MGISNLSLRAQKTPWKRRQKECKCQRDSRTPRKQDPLNKHDQSLYECNETVTVCIGACMGLHQVLCVCILASRLVVFMGFSIGSLGKKTKQGTVYLCYFIRFRSIWQVMNNGREPWCLYVHIFAMVYQHWHHYLCSGEKAEKRSRWDITLNLIKYMLII